MPEHTIAENLTRLQNAKTAIANAITAKGGTVGSGDGFEEFAADIGSIPISSGLLTSIRCKLMRDKSTSWETMDGWSGTPSGVMG